MHQSAPAAKAPRQSNLELLRILSMAIIVLHHYAMHSDFSFPEASVSFNRFFISALTLFGTLGNVLFVLISGYFMVTSRFTVRKLLQLWGSVVFYSLLFSAIFYASGARMPLREIYSTLLPMFTGRYWFASTYALMFIFSPFMNLLIDHLSRELHRKLVLMLFVCGSFLQTFIPVFTPFNNLLIFVLLYFLAAYLRLYPDSLRFLHTRRRCLGVGAAIYVALLGFLLVDLAFGARFGLLEILMTNFKRTYSAPLIALGVCIFRGFCLTKMRPNRLINRVATCAFGIYLVHEHPQIRDYVWLVLFHSRTYAQSSLLVLHALACCAAVFVASQLIELARQATVEKIYLRALGGVLPIRAARPARWSRMRKCK